MNELKQAFSETRPSSWENLPDIELYMDQVLGYMPRQHLGLSCGETLTAAMINNYIKQGILPRASGKKYSKEHIVVLTAICLLKQVLPVSDVGVLLEQLVGEGEQAEGFYRRYTDMLNDVMNDTAQRLKQCADDGEKALLALELSMSSYAAALAARQIVADL